MSRFVSASLFVLCASLPASALACGMYIPPEKDALLTELFEEIDAAPAVEVMDPAAIAAATQANQSNDAVEQVDSRPHRKLFNRNK